MFLTLGNYGGAIFIQLFTRTNGRKSSRRNGILDFIRSVRTDLQRNEHTIIKNHQHHRKWATQRTTQSWKKNESYIARSNPEEFVKTLAPSDAVTSVNTVEIYLPLAGLINIEDEMPSSWRRSRNYNKK